jgi:protein-S-isoprenylcysteine O-methyltransferase Ste14
MDSVRYVLALVMVVLIPTITLSWLVIHSWVRFWRRVGPVWTYSLLGVASAACWLGLYRIRGPLLSVEFGTSVPLVVLGALCVAVAVVMAREVRRQLTPRILLGLPEIIPHGRPGRLLTGGIYAHLRHPRYVESLLGLVGCALIANYLTLYGIVALSFPVIYFIVLLEEKELRDRFGAEYVEYCRRVPRRFVPRLRRPS